jgi:hypothetical protein
VGRSISFRGNRTVVQNVVDALGVRDETTGVYTSYVEYYAGSTEDKFIEIKLSDLDDETHNYLKAIYTRYDTKGNALETRAITLVYEGRVLIDVDNANINNDFYPTSKVENILTTMINVGGMANQLLSQGARISTLETNLNAFVNGIEETPREPGLTLDAFVEVTESKDIGFDDYGKILKCEHADTPIVLTIPVEVIDEDNPASLSASSFKFIKTGVADVSLAVAEGVTLLQTAGATGTTQKSTWVVVEVIRVEANKWLVIGELSAA